MVWAALAVYAGDSVRARRVAPAVPALELSKNAQ
jgi:hypothetical protein